MSLHTLRTRLRLAKTQWSIFSAGPDRRRRRQWARRWETAAARRPASSAADPAELAAQGFSLCPLDPTGKAVLLEEWQRLKADLAGETRRGLEPRTTGKVFFEEMLSEAALQQYPSFLATALDEGVLASVTEAMGMLPHLESIDILASTHTEARLSASQLWHYDVNDARIVKLFIYLEDCGPRNGPFTFIPADRSQEVANAVGHYVDDEHIAKHVARQHWRTVEGAAGTAFLIDTGRCYHFGSRSELTRYAYVATYSSGLKFMQRSRIWGDVLGAKAQQLSELQRMACGLEE